jgi:glycosyltransferase involved in cell wall biosynthesis
MNSSFEKPFQRMMDGAMLENISILIPTFHRRGYLRDCVNGIAANLPECTVLVASDDGLPSERIGNENSWFTLPYDVGLTAKRNILAHGTMTRYALMGSDDFDFSTPEAREGIIRLAQLFKASDLTFMEIDVACGRVNNRPYEGYLEYVPGRYIKEHRIGPRQVSRVTGIDIAANYFLARAEFLRKFPWDETIRPIGGEHADWFLDLKEAGRKVVYVPGVNINELPKDRSKEHPDYRTFRNRCWEGHATFMKKRGIKRYFGFDENPLQ